MFYRTITEAIHAELTIKKSKFIGILIPLSQVYDVEVLLQDIHKKYPGANHYCFSYVVRQDDSILERCSDDGEPSGTAGWPMLNVLKKSELENVMAVVVRYFGGILLGTGGLVRAYTQAVQSALSKARIIGLEYSQKLIVTLEYHHYGSFQNQFIEIMSRVSDIQYTDRVSIEVWIAVDQLPAFTAKLDQLTGGTASIDWHEEGFFPRKVEI